MQGLFAYSDHLRAVGATLRSQPWYVFKVVSVFKAPDPLYLQLLAFIVTLVIIHYRQRKHDSLSSVDQLWSILPPFYVLLYNIHYYITHGAIHQRLLLLLLLVIAWSVRLTYNLYIKAGYNKGHEDYRWQQLRGIWFSNQLVWEIIKIALAGFYLPLTNWLQCTLPAYVIYRGGSQLQPADFVLALVHLFFLAFEAVADHQMFTFQHIKKVKLRSREFSNITGDTFTDGFLQSGLYKYSRHPNYFGEIGQWFTIFLFSCIYVGFNWSVLGFLNFCVLFYQSLYFTEFYTYSKYPQWKYYAGKLNPIFPRPPNPKAKEIRIHTVAAKDMDIFWQKRFLFVDVFFKCICFIITKTSTVDLFLRELKMR
ncbi:hypothetical protein RFI_02931 [Reticulomyxa filosa]|uniref:Uncharacterized protein n=1 Tax=Reticulomyxa filosa TaxID=46433 RepID=X6P943_RETFI|nr:hypothetical protein RFI_02931 [Reticulomyxa filosa]|eukprot:ETO34162.1 hypothetical protein RFI_02931 [Reticulomyxa filosa]